mmetsp:Transcript_62184/g.151656  ORF Transcript_62184/g.151656 Transcript_62184/m.151656 type:complete len:101 (+) Transcript_62184:691-993(+)
MNRILVKTRAMGGCYVTRSRSYNCFKKSKVYNRQLMLLIIQCSYLMSSEMKKELIDCLEESLSILVPERKFKISSGLNSLLCLRNAISRVWQLQCNRAAA